MGCICLWLIKNWRPGMLLQARPCLYDLVQLAADSLEQHIANSLAAAAGGGSSVSHGGAAGDTCAAAASPAARNQAAPESRSTTANRVRTIVGEAAALFNCCIQVDHMHNRPLYVRTLKAWASSLDLTGRIMFHKASDFRYFVHVAALLALEPLHVIKNSADWDERQMVARVPIPRPLPAAGPDYCGARRRPGRAL